MFPGFTRRDFDSRPGIGNCATWEMSQLTDDKFITITIDGVEKRFYKTGDLGKYDSNGNIEFLGKKRFSNQA